MHMQLKKKKQRKNPISWKVTWDTNVQEDSERDLCCSTFLLVFLFSFVTEGTLQINLV